MGQKIEKEQTKKNKWKLICSAGIAAVALALIVGLSYAWFFNRSNMATLVAIAPPSPISIKGAHGQDLQSLDLSYGSDEKVGDKVTIHRVIAIKSTGDHRLELVHTTNLKGLTFTLYPAKETTDSVSGSQVVSEKVGNAEYFYTYDQNSSIKGHYINTAANSNENDDYKYADGTNKGTNYTNLNNVQTHVEPVYWISEEALKADTENPAPDQAAGDGESGSESTTEYLTYYVLEISWTEEDKETDIFYVMAQGE